MSESVIEIKNLTKKFRNLTAVNNLSLCVNKGDLYGFLGPNGAGKSTTIRMLLTLIFPTAGEISLLGLSVHQNNKNILQKVGALVEKPDFYNYLTAYKNLEICAKLSNYKADKKKIMQTLELVGLDKRYDSRVRTFSHGMKQRLGLAQVLIHDPELIILDEPGNGLDPQSTKDLRELLIDLNRNHGKTIFLSSHILHEIELMATRMVIINKGSAVVEGNVSDLLNASQLKVKFELENIEKAKELVKNSQLAEKAESQTESSIVFSITKDEIPLINRFFVEHNIDVTAIVPVRSLEEYFLKLT